MYRRLWQNALLDSPASQSEIWSWVRSKCDWGSAQDFGFNSKVFECILEARVKEHWKRIINSVCCHRDLFKAFFSCLSVKRPLLVHWNDYILPQVQAIYGEQQASRCVFHLFKSFEEFILWNFFALIPFPPTYVYFNVNNSASRQRYLPLFNVLWQGQIFCSNFDSPLLYVPFSSQLHRILLKPGSVKAKYCFKMGLTLYIVKLAKTCAK